MSQHWILKKKESGTSGRGVWPSNESCSNGHGDVKTCTDLQRHATCFIIHKWSVVRQLPSGNSAQLWKITMFNGQIHYKCPYSIAMLNYQMVTELSLGYNPLWMYLDNIHPTYHISYSLVILLLKIAIFVIMYSDLPIKHGDFLYRGCIP